MNGTKVKGKCCMGVEMKIRNGHVSNSSSSSFVLVFEKMPDSAVEMLCMMFGHEAKFNDSFEKTRFTKGEIAEQCFNDVVNSMNQDEDNFDYFKADVESLAELFSKRYRILCYPLRS